MSGSSTTKVSTATIISWNILSNYHSIIESHYLVRDTQNHPLFPPSFLNQRVKHILAVLENMISRYQQPIFCLQEVNDHPNPDHNLVQIVSKFFKDRYYIVMAQPFGTVDPVFGELGNLTAIPSLYYNILDYCIQKVYFDRPNNMITVLLQKKESLDTLFTIINTHLPVLPQKKDIAQMMDIAQSLVHKVYQKYRDGYVNIVLCGDLNTKPDDPWYEVLETNFYTTGDKKNKISHLSIRPPKSIHGPNAGNSVFQGYIDHVFWDLHTMKPDSIMIENTFPAPLSIETTKNLTRSSPGLIPNVANPSDHYPLILRLCL